MSLRLQTLIPLATTLFLIGCGGGGGGDSSTPSNQATGDSISFSGVAVDGYISGGTACLDTNVNGKCDSGEPTAPTGADGTFSFSNVTVDKGLLVPVIVTGGTDTATGKAFTGELKNIVNSSTVNAGASISVTPLTDLVATSFIASPTKDTTTLQQSKSSVASSIGLTADKVDADPMKDKEVFAKAMVVQQTKELLLSTSTKATGVTSNSSDTDRLRKSITQAIVTSMQDSSLSELDATDIISKLETIDTAVVIPDNEKKFIQTQVSDISTALTTLVNDTTADTSTLTQVQTTLETQVDTAKETIANATETSTLAVVPIKIEPQPVASTLATPPTPPTL
jgi:hypothetical protein